MGAAGDFGKKRKPLERLHDRIAFLEERVDSIQSERYRRGRLLRTITSVLPPPRIIFAFSVASAGVIALERLLHRVLG